MRSRSSRDKRSGARSAAATRSFLTKCLISKLRQETLEELLDHLNGCFDAGITDGETMMFVGGSFEAILGGITFRTTDAVELAMELDPSGTGADPTVVEDLGQMYASPDMRMVAKGIELIEQSIEMRTGKRWRDLTRKDKSLLTNDKDRFAQGELGGGLGALLHMFMQTRRVKEALGVMKVQMKLLEGGTSTDAKDEYDTLAKDHYNLASGCGLTLKSTLAKFKIVGTDEYKFIKERDELTREEAERKVKETILHMFASSIESQVVNLSRNLLMRSSAALDDSQTFANVRDFIMRQCNITSSESALPTLYPNDITPSQRPRSVGRADLLRVLERCAGVQGAMRRFISMLDRKDGPASLRRALHHSNRYDWIPLHYAASVNSRSITRQLLKLGSDVDAKTMNGLTAAHVAAMRGSATSLAVILEHVKETAGLVVARTVTAAATDAAGRTPMQVACVVGHSEALVRRVIKRVLEIERDDDEALLCGQEPGYVKVEEDAADADNDGGGWLNNKRSRHATGLPADRMIAERDGDSLSPDEFVRDFLSVGRPVIIRGAIKAGSQRWKNVFEMLRRDTMLSEDYRHTKFSNSTIPYGSSFSMPENEVELGDFVEYMDNVARAPGYIFNALSPLEGRPDKKSYGMGAFQRLLTIPDVANPRMTTIDIPDTFQLFVEPMHSGSPVHFHHAAINCLVYGQKRWFVFPPNRSFYSTHHVLHRFKSDYPKLQGEQRPYEIIQNGGDIMYVPDHYGHAVLNLQASVGFAFEFDYGAYGSAHL